MTVQPFVVGPNYLKGQVVVEEQTFWSSMGAEEVCLAVEQTV